MFSYSYIISETVSCYVIHKECFAILSICSRSLGVKIRKEN